MSKLKSCPFCGGSAELRDFSMEVWVSCYNSKCKVSPQTQLYKTSNAAIAAWNKRPAPIRREAPNSHDWPETLCGGMDGKQVMCEFNPNRCRSLDCKHRIIKGDINETGNSYPRNS